ncbi:MAG: AAA family ATPase, partial [Lachnospiraceae bacterium]|nr:AAA family ATPase [Lachnospiraceae bacterium]
RDIFHEITCRSEDVLQTETEINKGTRLVVVTSASGGVGKTTAAMGLAAVLSTNYKRVLYISTDPLQTFRHMLRNRTPISENDIYTELMHADDTVYGKIRHGVRKEQFSYLPPLKAPLISLGICGDVFVKIAESAKRTGEFDYILLDADCSFDENKMTLLELADQVLFVTGQNAASIEATNILVENINGIDREKFIFLGNDFVPETDNVRGAPQIPRTQIPQISKVLQVSQELQISREPQTSQVPQISREPQMLQEPQVLQKFEISEYVEHFDQYDQMGCADFAEQASLRRAAYLLK